MSITPESVKTLLDSQDYGDRLRAINHIRQLDPAMGFELIQTVVEDPNPRIRYAAVSQIAVLGQQNRQQAMEILLGRLRDSEADVQAAAADSIAALKLSDAFDHLKQLYQTSSEWLVKFSIIAALGELGDKRGFELLEDALKSDNELMQTAAIGSMGELGDDRAVPLLLPFATNPDWQIRYRVAQALCHLNSADARATLEVLAKDELEQIAQEARSCLNRPA